MVVQLPIRFLLGLPRPKIKVRFVPDFEIPLRHFVDTVAIDQMPEECLSQPVPTVPILRRRNIRFVPEGMKQVGSRQLIGHEADLNEWTESVREQAVIDLINIREVINW